GIDVRARNLQSIRGLNLLLFADTQDKADRRRRMARTVPHTCREERLLRHRLRNRPGILSLKMWPRLEPPSTRARVNQGGLQDRHGNSFPVSGTPPAATAIAAPSIKWKPH